VERSTGIFEPREVKAGRRFRDRVQIVRGVSEGERVVTGGTFLVDSESRLKSGQVGSKQAPHEQSVPNSEPQVAISTGKVKDAVCGMMIDQATAVAEGHTVARGGLTYYFCSDRCQRKFTTEREHYLALNPTGPRP
jgi:YHS domain-containing protein